MQHKATVVVRQLMSSMSRLQVIYLLLCSILCSVSFSLFLWSAFPLIAHLPIHPILSCFISSHPTACKEIFAEDLSVALAASHKPIPTAHSDASRAIYPEMRARKVPVMRGPPNGNGNIDGNANGAVPTVVTVTRDVPERDKEKEEKCHSDMGVMAAHAQQAQARTTFKKATPTVRIAIGTATGQHPARKHPLNACPSADAADHFSAAVQPLRISGQHGGIVMRSSRGKDITKLLDRNGTDQHTVIARSSNTDIALLLTNRGPDCDPHPNIHISTEAVLSNLHPPHCLPLDDATPVHERHPPSSSPSLLPSLVVTSDTMVPVSNTLTEIGAGAPSRSSFLQLELDSDTEEDW